MRLAAVILVGLFAVGALAQRPAGVLEDAIRRQPQLSYKGTREVEAVIGGRTIRLTEIVSRNRERSRTTYPSDSPRKGVVIVESPRERWEYNPERNEVRKLPRQRDDNMMLMRGLVHGVREGRLTAKLEEPTTIAGRRATGIRLEDSGGRAIRRLWIDEPTGMILKAEQYGPGGRKLASYTFIRIDFSPTFSATEFSRPGPPDAKVVDRPPDFGVDWTVRTPAWLPPNFTEVGRGVRHLEGKPVLMMHFSDGSKSFSMFQGRGPRPPRFGDEVRKPGFEFYSLVQDGLWLVGLGRVEKATLERVLKSCR